jgi:hypothetical protein
MDETAHFMDETAHFLDDNVTFQSYGSKGHFMDETAKLMEKKIPALMFNIHHNIYFHLPYLI